MIFQDPFSSLNGAHTICHHIERPLRIHNKTENRSQMRQRINDLLSEVGLNPPEEFTCRYPHQLSGGQRQRVAIARALAVDPELILADEPISMLDVSIRIGILNLMTKLKNEYNISIIYITHDLASARYIADKTMVMYAGHMVEGGDSEDVITNPAHPYTQLLLSAVPDPHAGLRTRQDISTLGEVPILIDPPPGCPFIARCQKTMNICREKMPEMKYVKAGQWVRCYLYN